MKMALAVIVKVQIELESSVSTKVMLYTFAVCVSEHDTYFFHSECNESDNTDVSCKVSGGVCVYNSTDPKVVACFCDGVPGFVVARDKTCNGMYVCLIAILMCLRWLFCYRIAGSF